MIGRIAGCLVLLAGSFWVPVQSVYGQSTVSVTTGNPAIVNPPTATDYAAGISANSGTMTIVGNCSNGGNTCSIKIAAGSTVLTLEYAITSNPTSGDCQGGGPGQNVATLITTSAAKVVGIKQNKNCTVTVQYKVRSLSYTTHTAGSTSTTYSQPLTFTITSP